jgi:hypothetical protein
MYNVQWTRNRKNNVISEITIVQKIKNIDRFSESKFLKNIFF